jgi:hypothetical protein
MPKHAAIDTAMSIVHEYTNNAMEGCTTDGDFIITTFHEQHLEQLTKRMRKIGWMCSGVNTQSNHFCTIKYQPYDEWFEYPLDF